MKLSEVIKAIEDGSRNVYVCGKNKVEYFNGNLYLTYNDVETNQVPLDGWEEVKPPRQWSEKELMLFKLFPWANYYSKNGYGDLVFTELKANKIGDNFELNEKSSGRYVILAPSLEIEFDSTVTKEESPIYIGDLKGE